MGDRRPVSYKEFDTAQKGYCLLITGGMMSEPVAIVERYDGTVTQIPIDKIQFLDSDAWVSIL
jgi:hypothetical protein